MFGQSLGNYRRKYNLTQQQFIDGLIHYDSEFCKLDAVTLSRWENNKTEPPLRKKILINDFMNELREFIHTIDFMDANKIVDSYIKNKFGNSSIIITDSLELEREEIKVTYSSDYINAKLLNEKYFVSSKLSLESDEHHIIAFSRNNQVKSVLLYNEDKISNSFVFTLLSDTLRGFKMLFISLMTLIIDTTCANVVIYSFDKYDNDLWKSTVNSGVQYMKLSDNIVRNELTTTKLDFLSNRYFIDLYIKSKR
ncbi:TPA: hypothetical protein ACX6SG_002181 [Photobacterium damselae]